MWRQTIAYNRAAAQNLFLEFTPTFSLDSGSTPTLISGTVYDPGHTQIEVLSGSYVAAEKLIKFNNVFPSASYDVDRGYTLVVEYTVSGSTVDSGRKIVNLDFDVGARALQPTVRAIDIWRIHPEAKTLAFTDLESECLDFINQAWDMLLDELWIITKGYRTEIVTSSTLKGVHQALTMQLIAMAYGDESLSKYWGGRYSTLLQKFTQAIELDTDGDGLTDGVGTKGTYGSGRMSI